MVWLVAILVWQQPLVIESPLSGGPGPEMPRVRVTLASDSYPAVLDFEGWVETSTGKLPIDQLELRLLGMEGFEVAAQPSGKGSKRLRVTQTVPGPRAMPGAVLRWKLTGDDPWQELVWPDPLGQSVPPVPVRPGAPNRGKFPVDWRLGLLIVVLAAGALLAWLCGRAKPRLAGLLARPKPSEKAWWDRVHQAWLARLGGYIPLQPGTVPTELGRLWSLESLPEPDQVASLTRRLHEIRFQPAPEVTVCEGLQWIDDARAWLCRVGI